MMGRAFQSWSNACTKIGEVGKPFASRYTRACIQWMVSQTSSFRVVGDSDKITVGYFGEDDFSERDAGKSEALLAIIPPVALLAPLVVVSYSDDLVTDPSFTFLLVQLLTLLGIGFLVLGSFDLDSVEVVDGRTEAAVPGGER